jgi:hypothetical protein
MSRVIDADAESKILAGWMVERGKQWSKESAAEVEEFFDRLTDPNDMAVLEKIVLQSVLGFMRGKIESSATSPTYSDADAGDAGSRTPESPTEQRTTAAV